jgi:AcrR family transcriptional regulator
VTSEVAQMDSAVIGHPLPQRLRKREQVRARVETVALDLFRVHGFDRVTVERIAGEAGVGPTTFYRYFGTKDGVLFAYQSGWLRAVREAVDELDVDLGRAEQVRALLDSIVGVFEAQLERMQLRDEIVQSNPTLLPRTLAVQRTWEQELATSLIERRNLAAGDLGAQTDAALVLLLVRLAFRRWRAGAEPGLREGLQAVLDDLRLMTS